MGLGVVLPVVNGNHGDSLELLTWMMSSRPAGENIEQFSQRQTKSPKITDRSKVAFSVLLVIVVSSFVCAEKI